MELNEARKIVEALLFVADQPVTLKMLLSAFDNQLSKEDIKGLIEELRTDYHERGGSLELREIAGGWQMSTRPEFAPWIRKLFKDRLSYRLSPSAMETLSIISYKQPITRGEIEEIRGVETSAVVDTLIDRRLVRIVGRKETLGRPILFGTTPEFLRAFGLKRLEELPPIDSLLPPAEAAVAATELETAAIVTAEEPQLEAVGVVAESSAEDIEAVKDAVVSDSEEEKSA